MMLLPASLLSLICATTLASSVLPNTPQHLFSNPPAEDEGYRIPTVHESTVMARRILHLSTIGTLVTSFPPSQHAANDELSAEENRPPGMQNSPIGLMEYYADCEANGNPTMLAIDIATPYRNYAAGSNISLAVRWWPDRSKTYSSDSYPYTRSFFEAEIPTPRTPAALPRFSLHGRLERLSAKDLENGRVAACFLRAHPDSVLWQPGNDISHESEYVRLVVEHVYWFGGFGDRARIGWLPMEDWHSVTMDEVVKCRLPGEEGEREWKAGL